MTHKSNILFENVGINFTFDKNNIMTDFEHGLRKVLKKLYSNSILEECYFRYTKALWNKAKKHGMLKKIIFH